MYSIQNGLGSKWRPMAGVYAFFGLVAALGVGNATQINAVIGGIGSVLNAFGKELPFAWILGIGILLAVMITVTLAGGAGRIGRAAEAIVPVAAVFYILLALFALTFRVKYIPQAFSAVFCGAFDPGAVTGGVIGSWFVVLRVGAARGVFTNEAGMGTASIAHAGAEVEHPTEQGLMGIMEVFIDTILICTLTAMVILTSGVHIPYGYDAGVGLTADAFSSVFGSWITIPITLCLCAFAIATVLGWSLYGVRCAQYLFGEGVWKHFAFAQGAMVLVGAILGTGTVWILSEMINGLMSIPNLIALAMLTPEILKQMKK